jgi:hypothetical protein
MVLYEVCNNVAIPFKYDVNILYRFLIIYSLNEDYVMLISNNNIELDSKHNFQYFR